MKEFLRSLLQRAGFRILRNSDDAVLEDLLSAYSSLRVGRLRTGEMEQRLSKVAFLSNLRSILRDNSITCVLDVGANAGQFAESLRRLGYTGRIISFEPATKPRGILHAAAEGDPQWSIEPYALGSAAGTGVISVYMSDTFSSMRPVNDVGRENFGEFLGVTAEEKIEVKRLDDQLPVLFPDGIPKGLLLKTDTQGYDLDVLQGSARTLECTQAVVTEAACEAIYANAPLYREVLAFLEAAGFAASGFYPTGHRKDALVMMEFDALFVRVRDRIVEQA